MGVRVLVGDCAVRLRELPAGSARMCVTSPPYYGLRDYGVEGQIGLEETPDAYVRRLVEVFREVRRVLADDGTLWLNIGDSYASAGGAHGGRDDNQRGVGARRVYAAEGGDKAPRRPPQGVKPKDMLGIPWRVALALQTDGWFLRQDIIWHKPNPMPESVKDRFVRAHEYLFLLSKRAGYFFNHGAVREPAVTGGTRTRRSVWEVLPQPFAGAHFAAFPVALVEPCLAAGSEPGDTVLDPFGGSGTTAIAAHRHARNAVLCELSPAYAELAVRRIAAESLFPPVVSVELLPAMCS